MRKRFFIRSVLISLAGILVFAVCSALLLYNLERSQQQTALQAYLDGIAIYSDLESDKGQLAHELADFYGAQLRVTILDFSGKVLGDSQADPGEMENHSQREEVVQAMREGRGSSVRYSSTLHKNVLYCAVRADSGGILVRGMLPVSGIFASFLRLLPVVLISAALALIISAFLAKNVVKGALAPIQEVNASIDKMREEDFTAHVPYTDYEELNPLIKNVNALSTAIRHSLANINAEKEKLNFILDHIGQGVVMLDKTYSVIHVNGNALSIFGATGREITSLFQLTRNAGLLKAVEKARGHESSQIDLELEENGPVYAAAVLPIHTEQFENSSMVILTDVTQERHSEAMRREFFSNASHELKTPVTSIMGFSELIEHNLAENPEDIVNYARIIHRETEKLSELIEDMTTISALEEHEGFKTAKPMPVYEILKNLQAELSSSCKLKNITLLLNLRETATVPMTAEDFSRVMKNLMENAVKYGKDNGKITVSVHNSRKKTVLIVEDDGIGIGKADQSRIFERLYRADKSHSPKVKGSGLGLSIVKHIVQSYHGTIQVESELGKGSKFTVTLTRS